MQHDDRYMWKDRQRAKRRKIRLEREPVGYEALGAIILWGFLIPAATALALWLVSLALP